VFYDFPLIIDKKLIIKNIINIGNYNNCICIFKKKTDKNTFKKHCKTSNFNINNVELFSHKESENIEYNNKCDLLIIDDIHIEYELHLKNVSLLKPHKTVLFGIDSLVHDDNLIAFKWILGIAQMNISGAINLPKVHTRKIEMTKDEKLFFDCRVAEVTRYENIIKKNILLIENTTHDYYKKKLESNNFHMTNNMNKCKLKIKRHLENVKIKYFNEKSVFNFLKEKDTVFLLPDHESLNILENNINNKNALLLFNSKKNKYIVANNTLSCSVKSEIVYIGTLESNEINLLKKIEQLIDTKIMILVFIEGTKEEETILNTFLKLQHE
jgi:hypothetical protein